MINQPWYYFYETNKEGRIPYKMTKPTKAQIEEALGTSEVTKARQEEPESAPTSTEQVQTGAQSQFSSFLPGHNYSDPKAWTAEQVTEATLEAVKRKNKPKSLVKVESKQLEMTNSGQMTLRFDPPIDFPAYMLASNSEKSNSRNLSHLNMKTWVTRED